MIQIKQIQNLVKIKNFFLIQISLTLMYQIIKFIVSYKAIENLTCENIEKPYKYNFFKFSGYYQLDYILFTCSSFS